MAVDRSGGPRNGWIYLFWTNIGVPGVNAGDADVYVARSRDGGLVWDAPVRVNDDATTNAQWQVWGTSDQANGDLYAVFLDRREDPADVLARTWVARSTDGGESWVQQPVGDVPFIPRPIPNNHIYMGDYIGIAAQAGRVVPLWSDWRENPLTAYTSPLVFDIAAPFVYCPEPRTVEASARGGVLAGDAQVASFLSAATAQDETDAAPEVTNDAPAFFPLGATLVTFTATDDAGHTSQCSAPLTVVDTTPPALELEASEAVLTPANHRMVPIDVTASVVDVADPEAGFVLVAIESSEPEQGLGHGDPPIDIQQAEFGTPDTRFLLRAESFARDGRRTYTIEYAASDASGNVRTRTLAVRVEP